MFEVNCKYLHAVLISVFDDHTVHMNVHCICYKCILTNVIKTIFSELLPPLFLDFVEYNVLKFIFSMEFNALDSVDQLYFIRNRNDKLGRQRCVSGITVSILDFHPTFSKFFHDDLQGSLSS